MTPVMMKIAGETLTAHTSDAQYVAATERSMFRELLNTKSDAETLIEMAHDVARDGHRLKLDADTKALIQETMGTLLDLVSETSDIGVKS